MADWLTWSEFKDEVLGLLPLDKDRIIQGDDDGTFLEKQIRLAAIDLQNFIPVYRFNHETIYVPSDFVTEGSASRAVLPPQAKIRETWLFDTSSETRHPVSPFDWESRFELINGFESVADNRGRMAIDPGAYTFYVYPEVTEGWILSLWWDGLKEEFNADDATPFTFETADAASEFVLGQLARVVERDMAMHQSVFRADPHNPGSYILKRKNLFLSAKERTRMKQ
jgi:hypothetical protein